MILFTIRMKKKKKDEEKRKKTEELEQDSIVISELTSSLTRSQISKTKEQQQTSTAASATNKPLKNKDISSDNLMEKLSSVKEANEILTIDPDRRFTALLSSQQGNSNASIKFDQPYGNAEGEWSCRSGC
ncbi:unnamed protein product, partial [Didymodactylos carnosus]